MRKWLYSFWVFILFANSGYADGDKIYTTDIKELPVNSRQFISAHFSQVKIAHISIEKNWLGVKEYDVILTDGTEVEFFKTGEWKEVSRKGNAVPDAIILPEIMNYVKINYAGQYIVAIEKDDRRFEVKLNSGIELKFSAQGRFVKIDY